MTQRDHTPDPSVAAVLGDIAPYFRAARAVALCGTPAEIAVPIVRRLRRQSGVSAAPGLMTLVNAISALAVTHYFRRPAQWQRWEHKRIPGWAGIAGLVHLTLSPAAAAQWKRGVIFPRRSPLWAALVSPTTGLLHTLLTLVVVHRIRRTKGATPRSAPERWPRARS